MKTFLLTAAAVLCATVAFAGQPTGQAGVQNLKSFQAWVNTKQPTHVAGVPASCKTPKWSASCGPVVLPGPDGDDRSSGSNHEH